LNEEWRSLVWCNGEEKRGEEKYFREMRGGKKRNT
jgi:hypothetical protein